MLVEGPRRGVLRYAMHGAGLAGHALDEHADGHATRERVGVDNDVWLHAALAERHVDRGPLLRAHALLAMARRELVADHGRARDAEHDLDVLALGIACVAADHTQRVDIPGLVALVPLHDRAARRLVVACIHRRAFGHIGTDERQAIDVELRAPRIVGPHVGAKAKVHRQRAGRETSADQVAQVDDLRLVHTAVAKAALVRRLVQDHRVLHVVARVRDHSDDRIRAIREVVNRILVVQRRPHHRRLPRLQAVQLVVRAPLQGAAGRAHRLLAHLALVHVARTLVKVGEGRQIRHHTQDLRRRILHVRRHTALDLVRLARNVQVHLLKRTDMVALAVE